MSETPEFQLPSRGRGDDDTAIPRFYVKAVQNAFKSKESGQPAFDDVEFVEILIPGDRRSTWDGMVNDTHRQRWPRHYGAFKESRDAPLDGIPLSEWAAITRSQVEELAYMKVRTVEQLAAMSDQQINNSIAMGGMSLRDKAKRHIEQATGAGPAEKLAAENEALKANMSELQDKFAAAVSRLEVLERADAEGAGKKG